MEGEEGELVEGPLLATFHTFLQFASVASWAPPQKIHPWSFQKLRSSSLFDPTPLEQSTLFSVLEATCPHSSGLTAPLKGFVAIRAQERQIVVALGGSIVWQHYALAFLAALKRDRSLHAVEGGKVHSGFQQIYMSLRVTIMESIWRAVEVYPDFDVVVVGHSMGGVMALFTYADLVWKQTLSVGEGVPTPIIGEEAMEPPYLIPRLSEKVTITAITYGQPRFGNHTFCVHMNQLMDKQRKLFAIHHPGSLCPEFVDRVVRSTDMIPRLYATWAHYRHFGKEYYIEHDRVHGYRTYTIVRKGGTLEERDRPTKMSTIFFGLFEHNAHMDYYFDMTKIVELMGRADFE